MASLVFDQDEGEDKLLSQALYVDKDKLNQGGDEAETSVPKSGEEYLKRVIKESRKFNFVETGKLV